MVGLEEAIEIVSGFESEYPPQLWLGEMPVRKLFERECFEGPAWEIADRRRQAARPDRRESVLSLPCPPPYPDR